MACIPPLNGVVKSVEKGLQGYYKAQVVLTDVMLFDETLPGEQVVCHRHEEAVNCRPGEAVRFYANSMEQPGFWEAEGNITSRPLSN